MSNLNRMPDGKFLVLPLYIRELDYAMSGLYADGEIMGLDVDGDIIAWDESGLCPYQIDIELEELELAQLGQLERDRIERDMNFLGMATSLDDIVSAKISGGLVRA